MDVKGIFQKMNSGALKAHSELGTRDESKQNRNFGARITKLKLTTGVNAHILAMKDVVLKFNPFTCEEDETYNAKTPFRPILLVSQTLEGIQEFCKANPEVSAKWQDIIGLDMAIESVTLRDIYDAFKKVGFIMPRVMTYHTVALNFGGIQGFPEFRSKYMVDSSQLNADGTYDYGPDAPVWHQAAVFFNSLLKPEADDKQKELTKRGATKEQIASERRNTYSKSPVGFVNPTNLIPFFYFPFEAGVPKFEKEDKKGIEQALRFYSFSDKWTIPIKEAMTNPMYDEDIDFFDFQIKTPSSKDTKPGGGVYTDTDNLELYTAMQITNTDGRLALHGGQTVIDGSAKPNEEVFAPFMVAVRNYFAASQETSSVEGGETFEKIMAMSNRFRPITMVLDSFLPACNEVFGSMFANSKYFDDARRKANHVFLAMMNPANAMALAGEDEEDLEKAAADQAADISAIMDDISDKDGDLDGIILEEAT